MLKIDLRRLILLLTVATALLMLANTFYAGYQVQRDLLMQQTLESNRSYALKLARSADSFSATAEAMNWLSETPSRSAVSLARRITEGGRRRA